ncbi:MAG TPA: hypothetical protein VJ464_04385 [Blastocatellia bacterium]|nr:hypothetical protein [Blastocatellia bacterium]
MIDMLEIDTLIGGSLYFQQPLSSKDGLRLIKLAIEGLGPYMGVPFKAYLDHQSDILTKQDAAAFEASGQAIIFNHEPLAREMNRSTFFLTHSYLGTHPDVKQIRVYPSVIASGPELDRVWDFMTDVMPRFVEATQPGLAMATGSPEEDDYTEYLPNAAEIHPGELPPFFTPWNYIGPDCLTQERRRFLDRLPATRSEPFGEGWLLQVVRSLSQWPSPEFLERLRSAPNPQPVGYRQPRIDEQ